MKTIINRSKLIALAFILTYSLESAECFAGYKNTNDNTVELKYIGSENNQPLFQLNLNNSESDAFGITLRDASGNVIFYEEVKGTQISRKYRLNTDEIDVSGIRFEVTSKNSSTKTVYAVNRKSHVVEDVIVNRL
jgi:hypothetical protein